MAMTMTFRVPAMTCGHCEAAVSSEVGAVPGVTAVTVDLVTKLVDVTGDSMALDAVLVAFDDAGFDAEEVVTEDDFDG